MGSIGGKAQSPPETDDMSCGSVPMTIETIVQMRVHYQTLNPILALNVTLTQAYY